MSDFDWVKGIWVRPVMDVGLNGATNDAWDENVVCVIGHWLIGIGSTVISLYFNFPTIISLHYDFPIHKQLSYKIRSNQGRNWQVGRVGNCPPIPLCSHPCFGRLESVLQFNNACAKFAMPQGWPSLGWPCPLGGPPRLSTPFLHHSGSD